MSRFFIAGVPILCYLIISSFYVPGQQPTQPSNNIKLPTYIIDSPYPPNKLSSGDIVVDELTGDIGLLINRYDVLDGMYTSNLLEDDDVEIWAWDILWTGPETGDINRYQPYTENGLLNMIESGSFLHFSVNELEKI